MNIGNKSWKSRIERMTIISALLILIVTFASNCGGGGGGGGAPAFTYAVTSSSSYNNVNLVIRCSETASMVINWGDGNGQGNVLQCTTSDQTLSKGYNISSQQSVQITILFYRNTAERDAGTYTTVANATINPPQVVTNPTNNVPSIGSAGFTPPSPTDGDVITLTCATSGGDATGVTFEVKWGDGRYNSSSVCSFTHPYANIVVNPTKFTIQITAWKNDQNGTPQSGTPRFVDVYVMTKGSASIEPPRLDERYNTWATDTAYEWEITNPPLGGEYTFRGYAPTGCDSVWYKTTTDSIEHKIRDIASGNTTDWTQKIVFGSSAGLKVGVILYCKVGTTPGKQRIVDFYVDTVAPAKPNIEIWPRSVSVPSATYNIAIEDDCHLYRSINSASYTSVRPTIDSKSTVVNNYPDTVGFTTKASYTIRYYCIDDRNNKSDVTPIAIDYGVNSGGGTSGTCTCGNGICENYSNCSEDSGSCPNDCTGNNYCGDGVCNGNETTNSCPNDCGGSSSGNYTLQNTFTIPNGSVDLTAYNGNLLVTYGDGSVKQFDTGGGETDYTMSGTPAFGTPVSGSACVNNGRFVIADQTKNTTGQIDVFTMDTANHVLTFAFFFGYSNTETDGKVKNPSNVFCDYQNNFLLIDSGNNAFKKYNSTGTLVCEYTGATHVAQHVSGDNQGNAYLSDQSASRIDIIDSSCAFLRVVGSGSSTSNPLSNPGVLAVTTDGTAMAVDDVSHHRIVFYDPNLRIDKGYIGYSTSAAAIKSAAVIGTTFYFLRGSMIEVYQSN